MPPVARPTEAPSCLAVMGRALQPRRQTLILYSIDLRAMRGSHPFAGTERDHRSEYERFIEELRRDEPELASALWIEEHELEAGGDN